jgi:hypothetical protein
MPWRLPDWGALIFPVAVTVKRFLHDDLVFILGISHSLLMQQKTALACPYFKPGGLNVGGYGGGAGKLQPRLHLIPWLEKYNKPA